MPIPFSIPTYLQYAEIAQFLAANDQSNFVKNPGGTVVPDLSRLIYDVRTSLSDGYTQNPTNSDLVEVALYLYELIGKYIRIAQGIIGQTGGVVIVPGGGQSPFMWFDEEFTVGNGQPMEAGDTVITFQFPRFVPLSDFVTWNSAPIYRTGAIDQRTYGITYNATSVTFTLSEGVNNGDTMEFKGMYFP